jgi:hypothetical protein
MASLHEHDALLAAFLEATHKLDLRALRKHAAIVEMPRPVSVDVQLEDVSTAMLDVDSPKSAETAFALRRANLVAGS